MYVETQIGDVAILDLSDWSLSLYLCCHLGTLVLSARRCVGHLVRYPLAPRLMYATLRSCGNGFGALFACRAVVQWFRGCVDTSGPYEVGRRFLKRF